MRLHITDPDVTAEFYVRVLGLVEIALPDGRRALRAGDRTIALHEAGGEVEPVTLSLTTDRPVDLVLAGLDLYGVEAERTGPGDTVRFRDPDGHRVELWSEVRPQRICGTALRAIADLAP